MSKSKASKHTPRKPRPSELAAKAKKAKREPGRPATEGTAFDKTTMVRMFKADYNAFKAEATKLSAKSGGAVSVGAYLRMAGRAMIGAA